MSSPYSFSCAAMPSIANHTLKASKPDENGLYEVVVGCIGIPTRNNVWYDEQSLVDAMNDPTSRFNICLRDGNLMGEWGHPQCVDSKDIPRLLQIDEHYISHCFNKIWVDTEGFEFRGKTAYPIRAKIRPCGPYGDVLEKSLKDPNINTAFSIRSLCLPGTGPDTSLEYRKVQVVVTFDAVHAPGYDITSKRYAGGTESYEIKVTESDLTNALQYVGSTESIKMISDTTMKKLYPDQPLSLKGDLIGKGIASERSIVDRNGNVVSAASLLYDRNNRRI